MPSKDTVTTEAIAAAVGGATSSAILYPLEVLKTRMQADDNNGITDGGDNDSDEEKTNADSQNQKVATSSIQYARNIYCSEGMSVFFDGMEVSAFQSAIEKALYFFAYTALKRGYTYATTTTKSSNPNKQLSPLANVLLGCLAEWFHLPITLPIDALTTVIQTRKKTIISKTDKIDKQKANTVLALWMTLWKEKSFYKGIQAYWILCFKPALQYTIFEQMKGWILRLRGDREGKQKSRRSNLQLSAGEAFLLGMFSRMVATLVVFPFVRAKVRMQSLARGRSESSNHTTGPAEGSSLSPPVSTTEGNSCDNIWRLLAENYNEGGIVALYNGLIPELTRGVLSAALMMMVKERISGGVKKMLHGD